MRVKSIQKALAAALLLALSVPGDAQTAPAYSVEHGADVPSAAHAALERIVASGAPGVTMVVARKGRELTRVHAGAIDSTAQLPIASASKWLTAATIMALVDEGKISLDAPISRYLPQFGGEAGSITLRQMLSQTTGTPGSMSELIDVPQDARITLLQSAEDILARPLTARPGTRFTYAGPGFQLAGAVAEKVTGQRWEEIFQSRIGRPLGMKRTYWQHLTFDPSKQVPASETRNPILQGGAVSTVDDYMNFLTMLAANGRFHGKRILSARAIAEMHSNQTLKATMPPPDRVMGGSGYSLGNWCETWDAKAHCSISSSVGAFGVYPWIDRPSGLYGIVFLQTDLIKVWPDIKAAQMAAVAANRAK